MTKQQILDAINRNGLAMLKQDTLSGEDKDNIGKDLENLTSRFAKVGRVTALCLYSSLSYHNKEPWLYL